MAGGSQSVTFQASADRLYQAVMRSVAQLGYSFQHSDPLGRVVAFNTGMSMRSWAGQDMSATVIAIGDLTSELIIGGTRAQRGVTLTDWGEKAKIARILLRQIQTVLPTLQEAPSQA